MTPLLLPASLLQIATLDAEPSARAEATTVSPPQAPIERVMLAEDKLPVVLAVVLIVWAGLLLLVSRTDRRLARLERDLDARESILRDSNL